MYSSVSGFFCLTFLRLIYILVCSCVNVFVCPVSQRCSVEHRGAKRGDVEGQRRGNVVVGMYSIKSTRRGLIFLWGRKHSDRIEERKRQRDFGGSVWRG